MLAGRQEPGEDQQVVAGLVGVKRRDGGRGEEMRRTGASEPSWQQEKSGPWRRVTSSKPAKQHHLAQSPSRVDTAME